METIRRTGSTMVYARCLHCKRENFIGIDRWPPTMKLDAIEQRLVCVKCKCRKVELRAPGQPSIEDRHEQSCRLKLNC